MPDYDPLTISDEDLQKLPPAERGAVYKARAAARAGGAPPKPPAGRPAAPSASMDGTPGTSTVSMTPPPASPTPAPAPATVAAAAPATPAPAAAPRPAPAAPTEPEKPKQPAFVGRILAAIDGSTFQWRHGYAEIKVPRERLLDAARAMLHEGFDYLSFVTEVDWQDRYELIYHLFSYDFRAQPLGAILRCELPHDVPMPEVASLTPVWPGAEFMEREAFEMMGIRFLGHPDLRRILLPDDFVGFPMRRDYENDWDYITAKQLAHD